ncbi:MAG: hypothetical protein QOE61_1545 [Micromonosporaceae bacterium]|nr:hypothetical protein [Micromonosporaceae bacterium]
MSVKTFRTRLRAMTSDAVSEAAGRDRRKDPVLASTGGPAGNARLTAWTGVLLLVLFIAELVTLLDVRQLVSWHVVIGVLLVPPALLKTGSAGWRILRYYTGHRPYRDAGPPPLLLRILGPLVVISTLAVLASGLALIVAGPDNSRYVLVQAFGQRVDALGIHQATFAVWAVATGLHTLGRILPALRLTVIAQTTPRPVPGRYWRVSAMVVTLIAAAIAAPLVLGAAGAWHSQPSHRFPKPPGRHAAR